MSSYKEFLKKYRKVNGEKLLPKTINKYYYYVEKYIGDLYIYDIDKQIERINKILKEKESKVMYSALIIFLEYNYQSKVSKDGIFNYLEKDYKIYQPKNKANSFTSTRYLQSQVLNEHEIKLLFDNINDIKLKTAICFMLDTGIRRDELLNIKFRDIRTINKNNEDDLEIYNAGIRAIIKVLGKGKKFRNVYLHETSYNLLEELVKQFGFKKNNLVFCFYDKQNKIYKNQGQYLYDSFKKLGKTILNKDIHPHMTRHTALTNMVENGATTSEVQSVAGHSSSVTTNVYVKASDKIGLNGMIRLKKDNLKNIIQK